MKTKILLLTLFAFALSSLSAQEQEGEIIYTGYGPEGWSCQFDFTYDGYDYYFMDTLQLDLDRDGNLDCYFRAVIDLDEQYGAGYPINAELTLRSFPNAETLNSCDFRYYSGHIWLEGYSWNIGDTIANIHEYDSNLPQYQQPSPYWNTSFGYYCYGSTNSVYPRYIAFRFQKEDGYCYGWLEHEIDYTIFPHGHGGFGSFPHTHVWLPKVTIYRCVYCTIPNYPLRLGQTSFDWSFEEERERELATIHPNPTTGLVTVKGDNLHQVEVLNVMGQKVIAKQATAGETSIDLGSQPAGLYFINVTGQDGKRCVKKVVKQ